MTPSPQEIPWGCIISYNSSASGYMWYIVQAIESINVT